MLRMELPGKRKRRGRPKRRFMSVAEVGLKEEDAEDTTKNEDGKSAVKINISKYRSFY